MGLIDEKIIIKWHVSYRDHFVQKGYPFTGFKKEFEIFTNELPEGSAIIVGTFCDSCGKKAKNEYRNYFKSVSEHGKNYCSACAKRLFGSKKALETVLKKSTSFGQWCIDNNRQDVLDRWNNNLNGCQANEVCYSSTKKYWFNCPRGLHEPELKDINSLTNKNNKGNFKCNYCNSFAQWGIENLGDDFLEKYWSINNYEMGFNPWEIPSGSRKKVWINCQEKDYHPPYDVTVSHFTNSNSRCPYCKGIKVHPNDSLGQYIVDKYSKEFLEFIWSDKNEKSPFEYAPMSHSIVWWKCPDGKHDNYERKILNSNSYEFRCPSCTFSKGEKKIEDYLNMSSIIHKGHETFDGLIGVGNGLLSYDFYLSDYNLLIEYHGEQHYKYIKCFHDSVDEFHKQQEHDRRKREYAKDNNIKLLEIPYWDFNKIEEILHNELFKTKICELII